MKAERRVLVIARRYWPTTNDSTLRLRSFCQRLRGESIEASVLTPRWHRDWPRQVSVEEVPVLRLEDPPTAQMRQNRYYRTMADWLTKEASKYDAIYCDAASGDASTVLSVQASTQLRIPLIVRFDPNELSQHHLGAWQPTPRAIDACRRATTVVVPNSTAHQRILGAGIDRESVVRIVDWPTTVIDRSLQARASARRALAEINHDFTLRSHDRVVLCPGELTRDWGVDALIDALAHLIETNRSLRLWIHGDGIERARIYEALQFRGLHRIVVLPGMFTCMEALLQAADLCVFPAAGRGLGWLVPTCITSSIPFVAAQSPELVGLLGDTCCPLLYPAGNAKALQSWVAGWLRDSGPAHQAIGRVREIARQNVPLDQSLAHLLRLDFNRSTTTADAVR